MLINFIKWVDIHILNLVYFLDFFNITSIFYSLNYESIIVLLIIFLYSIYYLVGLFTDFFFVLNIS